MKALSIFYDKHPYWLSFTIACIFVTITCILIVTGKVVERLSPINTIDLITVQEVIAKKKQSSFSENSIDQKIESENRSVSGSDNNPIDLALNDKIKIPRLLTRLRQEHPKSGKNLNISALVIAEFTVLRSGKVRNVKIIRVKLSKKFPPRLEKELKRDYGATAKKRLQRARFSPPNVQGRPVAIRMTLPLRFQLK